MNQKRYWLRGILIGFVVSLILGALSIVAALSNLDMGPMNTVEKILYYSGFWPVIISDDYFKLEPILGGFQLLIIPFVYSLGGFIIGWIYGKTRNKGGVAM